MPVSSALVLMMALAAQDPAGPSPAGEPVATAPPAEAADPAPPTPSAPQPYQPPSVRPFEMPDTAPDSPVPYSPSANDRIPDKPVTLEAYRRSYEGPPDARERVFDAGVKRNFDAQQVRMGPLDGPWVVRSRTGAPVMYVMLHDPGRPDAEIEGAWRLAGGRSGNARSGFLVSVAREGQTLVIRWYDRDDTGNMSVMRLLPGADGRWSGTVQSRDVEYPVTMGR